jgi:hypothetical protein
MKRHFALAAVLALALAPGGAASAQQNSRRQGDWPCKQVRVPSLSMESVWSGPSLDAASKAWRDDPEIFDLVARVSVRRTPLEAAEKLIAEFAKGAGDKGAGDKRRVRLAMLFAGVFERLDAERREVIAGLDRYGLKQKEMAEKLRLATRNLREHQDKAQGDSEKLKQLGEALQWDLRIFEERGRALVFVCETPALIEQRLGALTRAIRAATP